LQPPIAHTKPRIGAKHRVETIPVWTHSVSANDVVDRKAGRKEYDNSTQQECDEIKTFKIFNQLQQRPVRHRRRSLSRLDRRIARSRFDVFTPDFLLRRKFHCSQAKPLTKVGLIFTRLSAMVNCAPQ
jgi:hypothetical protein